MMIPRLKIGIRIRAANRRVVHTSLIAMTSR
jgi:hypothetical protein